MDEDLRKMDQELRKEHAQLKPMLQLYDSICEQQRELRIVSIKQETVLNLRADICRQRSSLQNHVHEHELEISSWRAQPMPMKAWRVFQYWDARRCLNRTIGELERCDRKLQKFDGENEYVFRRGVKILQKIERMKSRLCAELEARDAELGAVIDRASAIESQLYEIWLELRKQQAPKRLKMQCYDRHGFWSAFCKDLRTARRRVIILSPYLATRLYHLQDDLQKLVQRGIELVVYSKPADEHDWDISDQLAKLKEFGATIVFQSKMHQKIALIDDAIRWEGSLNILSHCDTQEQMRRIQSKDEVRQAIAMFCEVPPPD